MNKVVVFIDGANVSHTCKMLGWNIDYKKLLEHLRRVHGDGATIRAHYYTATKMEDHGYMRIHGLLMWLKRNGYTVKEKPAKVWRKQGVEFVKGNVDVDMAVDALKMAHHGLTHAVFFTGDGDFRPVLLALQEMTIHCTVYSTKKRSNNNMIATELLDQADLFMELESLKAELMGRKVSE